MTTGIWQAGFYKEKRKKHFVGIQKILSLHVVVYQYNTVAEQKITVRKVLSDYNLTTKMDMPGRQTFWEPGICNDIMCYAKEAVCILF